MSEKKLERFIKARLERKPFCNKAGNISKDKLKIFIEQSILRVSAIVGCDDDKTCEKYFEIITRGVEIILIEQFVFDKLSGKIGDDISMALGLLGHMENIFIQEAQLLKDE